MDRSEVYSACLQAIEKSNCLLMELPTGFGKSKGAIDLVNYLCDTKLKGRHVKMLLLVAKRVHKITWKEEFDKWGGIKANELVVECYESLRKHEDESFDIVVLDECFRGDTEILTNSGYKQFKDLTEEDLVAQFTQEGNIEFVKPLRLIRRRHTGEICKLYLGRGRYCYLTPNHNMVYRTPNTDGWKMKPVSELCRANYTRIPVSGKGTGDNSFLTTQERLLIAIQADGTLQRHQENESVYSIQVTKGRKKERLKTILDAYDSDKWTKIKGREECDRYLIKLPKGDAKLLSTHFNINMGFVRANSFIEEVLEWDGSRVLEGNTLYYSSVVKENADFVAAVAIQAGYKVLNSVEKDDRKENYSDIYRVFMRKAESVSTQPMTKEYLAYDDDVYCVEVPTHMIVVRSEGYSFIVGNCHHLSENRRDLFKTINVTYIIGLSATIPRNVKSYFRYNYHSQVVSCDITEAIEDEVLPEPQILLFPLKLDNTIASETWEINPKSKGPIVHGEYKDMWKYKKNRQHAILSCTQKQKSNELNSLALFWKNRFNRTHNEGIKQLWLRTCGDRLEFYSDIKVPIIKEIHKKLRRYRTITFCKTIEQCEKVGKYCIHSKNTASDEIYERFNQKKINHITAVNILNENANLVDCKYGVFCNLSGSEVTPVQRIGRSLRHKKPVIIVPYWENTREQELVEKMFEGFNRDFIKVIHSVKDI